MVSKPLHYILKGLFQKESWKLKLLSEWDAITGTLSDKMRLEKIDGTTLVIGVFQASWMQELYLLSAVLLRSINEHLDKPYVKRLRFKLATHKEYKEPLVKQPAKKIIRTPISLSKREQEALHKIKDQELQKVLHAFLSRCHYQKVEK